MRRPLPSWAPFAIGAFGLLLVPILFAVPRESEAVDTFLEALPFVVVFLGAVAFPFSKDGAARMPGIVFVVVVLTAPLWFPLGIMLASDLSRDAPHVRVDINVLPAEPGPYVVLVPAPVDGDGDAAAVLRDERGFTLVEHNGRPYLRIADDSDFDRTYFLQGEKGDASWPATEFQRQGPRDDDAAFLSILESGNVSLTVHVRITAEERYCGMQWDYYASVAAGEPGTARLGDRDAVCS